MADLQGQVGELHMTLQITRKDSGTVETVELIGALDAEQLKQLKEASDGSDSHDSGA